MSILISLTGSFSICEIGLTFQSLILYSNGENGKYKNIKKLSRKIYMFFFTPSIHRFRFTFAFRTSSAEFRIARLMLLLRCSTRESREETFNLPRNIFDCIPTLTPRWYLLFYITIFDSSFGRTNIEPGLFVSIDRGQSSHSTVWQHIILGHE